MQLYNFFGYLMDHFTPASNESKIMPLTPCLIHWVMCSCHCIELIWSQPVYPLVRVTMWLSSTDLSSSLSSSTFIYIYIRKSYLAHLPREWHLSWHRMGEILLLQEHRGAWPLQWPPSNLSHDYLWGVEGGRSLQAQPSRYTGTQSNADGKCTPTQRYIWNTIHTSWRRQRSSQFIVGNTLLFSAPFICVCFFPVAAPFSICSAASRRNLEAAKNSP